MSRIWSQVAIENEAGEQAFAGLARGLLLHLVGQVELPHNVLGASPIAIYQREIEPIAAHIALLVYHTVADLAMLLTRVLLEKNAVVHISNRAPVAAPFRIGSTRLVDPRCLFKRIGMLHVQKNVPVLKFTASKRNYGKARAGVAARNHASASGCETCFRAERSG